MTSDELETLLLAWGRAYGEKPPSEWDEDASPTGNSPLLRGMAFAPGNRARAALREVVRRSGFDRRLLMGGGEQLVPAYACDPVPARETRVMFGRELASDPRFSPEVERVQTAALALHRFDTERGVCLRVHYCTRGARDDKVATASRLLDTRMTLPMYRNAVAFAKVWMHGRLAPLDADIRRA